MPPPIKDNLTWSNIGRAAIGALMAWAAWEFREMRVAVYAGQTETAVLKTEVVGIKKTQEEMKEEIRSINARLEKEK